MSKSIEYLSDSELQVECQFEIIALLDLHLTAAVNNHAILYFKVVIPLEYELEQIKNERIVFRNLRENNTIFNGVICTGKKYKRGELLYLEMTCKGRSWLLDFDLHSNTFQDETERHNDVLKRILSRVGAGSIVQNDTSMKPPLWQFEETDWSLARRVAAIMGTVLIADYSLDIPYVSVGFPERRSHVVAPFEYDAEVQYFEEYRKFKPENQHEREFRCGEVYTLGDSVIIHDQHKYIMGVDLKLEKGVLECVYSLGSKFTPERLHRINQDAEGVILVGTVLDSKAELLKVHFDVDESQSVDTAMWIPYKPDTSNVFYSMPEIGARVAAKFKHESAAVITSLHEESIDLYPSFIDRIFNIPRGQQMAMLQDELFFNDSESRLAIADADGFHCSTTNRLHLKAENDILINAHRNIVVRSPEQVKINKYGTPNGIDLSINEVKIFSDDTQTVSAGENPMPYPLRSPRDNEEVDLALVAELIGSSITRLNSGGGG